MKYFKSTSILLLIFGLILSRPQNISAQETPQLFYENIRTYNIVYEVREDASVGVTETIVYDFLQQQRHGIFRTIPLRYTLETDQGEKTYEMGIQVESVTDEGGIPYIYSNSTSEGEYTIKIGDPNTTITGAHTYVIKYSLAGSLRYFADHDEMYLNAIGPEWTIPILHAKARITVPLDSERQDEYKSTCYYGAYGAKLECAIGESELGTYEFSAESLGNGKAMSVVVGMPKGVVDVVSAKEVISFWDTTRGKILGAFFGLAALVWYVVLPFWTAISWYLYGRDPDVGYAPTSYFDPPLMPDGRELTPAETGVLIDEKVHPRDVLSVIVDLARRGHLKIVEKSKGDFYLEKQTSRESIKDLQNFEVKLLTDVFEDGNSLKMKNAEMYKTVTKIEEMLYEGLSSAGMFHKNPKSVRNMYSALIVLGAFSFNLPLVLVSIIFGMNMPRKTRHGALEANKAKGMYSFLKSQERQINFKDADPQVMFERLLPYAVALGVEKQWAEKFKDVNLSQPDWYESNSRTFNQAHMLHGLNSSYRSFSSPPVASGSSSGFSSGGGFSGGGGGGGGGGSW